MGKMLVLVAKPCIGKWVRRYFDAHADEYGDCELVVDYFGQVMDAEVSEGSLHKKDGVWYQHGFEMPALTDLELGCMELPEGRYAIGTAMSGKRLRHGLYSLDDVSKVVCVVADPWSVDCPDKLAYPEDMLAVQYFVEQACHPWYFPVEDVKCACYRDVTPESLEAAFSNVVDFRTEFAKVALGMHGSQFNSKRSDKVVSEKGSGSSSEESVLSDSWFLKNIRKVIVFNAVLCLLLGLGIGICFTEFWHNEKLRPYMNGFRVIELYDAGGKLVSSEEYDVKYQDGSPAMFEDIEYLNVVPGERYTVHVSTLDGDGGVVGEYSQEFVPDTDKGHVRFRVTE